MNLIFKVIWSDVRNAYVVVSEFAKSKVKGCSSRKRVIAAGVMAALLAGGINIQQAQAAAEITKDVNGNIVSTDDAGVVNSTANGTYNVAIGEGAQTSGNTAIAVGEYSIAVGNGNVAIGNMNMAGYKPIEYKGVSFYQFSADDGGYQYTTLDGKKVLSDANNNPMMTTNGYAVLVAEDGKYYTLHENGYYYNVTLSGGRATEGSRLGTDGPIFDLIRGNVIEGNIAGNTNAIALGSYTSALGNNSVAMGSSTIAKGDNSVAFGENTVADNKKYYGFDNREYTYLKTADGKQVLVNNDNQTLSIDYDGNAFFYGDGVLTSVNPVMLADDGKQYVYTRKYDSTTKQWKEGWFKVTSLWNGVEIADNPEAVAPTFTPVTGEVIAAKNTVAFGRNTQALNDQATAFGEETSAYGKNSTAFGYNNTASGENAVAFGEDNIASGKNSVAFGGNQYGGDNEASGDGSTVWGSSNEASGELSTAWGDRNVASGENATSWGSENVASGENATAWGEFTQASGRAATSWGIEDTKATGDYSTAFGRSDANGDFSTSFGRYTKANGDSSTAWGERTVADYKVEYFDNGVQTYSIYNYRQGTIYVDQYKYKVLTDDNGVPVNVNGSTVRVADDGNGYLLKYGNDGVHRYYKVTVNSDGSVSIATNQTNPTPTFTAIDGELVAAENNTAFGKDTVSSNDQATAWGYGSVASGEQATAWGEDTLASGYNATAWGYGSVASGEQGTAWGEDTVAAGVNSTAFGEDTVASGDESTAWGSGAEASGDYSTAWGDCTTASGYASTAWGSYSEAHGDYSTAFGDESIAGGENSLAALGGITGVEDGTDSDGNTVYSGGTNSAAIGKGAWAKTDDSVALGSGSVADRKAGVAGYDIRLNGQSEDTSYVWTATANAISVGDPDNEVTRQITGVAAGTYDTDAVNVAQLVAVRDMLGASIAHSTYGLRDQYGNAIVNELGEPIDIVTDNNIIAQAKDDEYERAFTFGLNKDVNLSEQGSLAIGNTVVNNDGMVISPSYNDYEHSDIIINQGNVSMGGNVITNVAEGVNGTDAVNVDQLKSYVTVENGGGFGLRDKDGNVVSKDLGETIEVVGDGNILAAVDAENNNFKVSLSDNIKLTDAGSITIGDEDSEYITKLTQEGLFAGNTTVNNKGITIVDSTGDHENIVINQGNINMGGNIITNVAEGVNGTDAVNVDQLKDYVSKNGGKTYTGSDSIEINDANEVSVKANDKAGLLVDGDGVRVNIDKGLAFGEDGAINANVGGGLSINEETNQIQVNVGKGLTINEDTNEINVNTSQVPLTYKANGGNNGEGSVSLAEGLDFQNGVNTIASVGADGKVKYDVSDTIELTNAGSIAIGDENSEYITRLTQEGLVAGNTTVNNNGITIVDSTGNYEDIVINQGNINMGGNVITNVAEGVNGTDAVNVDQLKDYVSKNGGKTYYGSDSIEINDANEVSVKANDKAGLLVDGDGVRVNIDKGLAFGEDGAINANVGGGLSINEETNQIQVNVGKGLTINEDTNEINVNTSQVPLTYKANGENEQTVSLADGLDFRNGKNTIASVGENGQVTYDVSDTIELTNKGSIAIGDENSEYITRLTQEGLVAGNTTVNNNGLTIVDATGNYEDIVINQGNVSMGGNQIHNVAAGEADSDAVNVGQLKDYVSENTKTYTGSSSIKIDGDNNNSISVITEEGKGLEVTDNGVGVKANEGAGVTVNGDGVAVKIDKGLEFGDNGAINANVGKGLSINEETKKIEVNVGKGLTVNEDTNEINVNTSEVPLTYKANGENAQTVSLADGLNFVDGVNTIASVDENGQVKYDVSDTIKLTEAGSITIGDENSEYITQLTQEGLVAGNTTVNNNGITVVDPDGVYGNIIINQGNVDMGGNQIHNVAEGTELTDAVNLGQLQNYVSENTKTYTGSSSIAIDDKNNNSISVITEDGKGLEVTDKGVGVKANENAGVAVNGDGVAVKIDKGLEFGDDGAINAKLGEGLSFDEDNGNAIKANVGGGMTIVNNAITANVGDGLTIDESTNKIVVDASQVPLTYKANGENAQTVSLEDGLNFQNGKNTTATVGADGKVTYSLNEEIELTSVTTKDQAGNTTVMNANGITINVAGSDTPVASFTSEGLKFGDTIYVSNAGLNAGNKVITNVADGEISATSKEAINGSQLVDYVGTEISKIKDVHVDTSKGYNVVTSTDPATGATTGTVTIDMVNSDEKLVIKDVASATELNNLKETVGDINDVNEAIKGGTIVETINNIDNKIGDINNIHQDIKGDTIVDAINNIDTKIEDVKTIASQHTTVKADDSGNVSVTEGTNAQGGKEYTISISQDLNLNSVTTGNTVLNNDGITFKEGDTALTKDGLTAGETTVNNNGISVGGENGSSLTKDSLNVGGKTYIDGNGINANGNKITNVAAGEADADAVNVGQLKGVEQKVDQNTAAINNISGKVNKLGTRINKVGAGAAALAALHPLDFDPDDKLAFSAGVGHYSGENAAAIGAFYRPTEKVMFSVGGTVGNGENMVNAGVTFALDKTNNVSNSRTAMAREILDMRGEMAEMKSVIAQLVAMNKALMGNTGKNLDVVFPDVPENHWAYEYVRGLAQQGIIEGYETGRFDGDRTMTRYEMAAMLYRALQKGQVLSERILAEFAPELGRIRVDRISGEDTDEERVERVRVNSYTKEYKDRDDYGSVVPQEAGKE